MPYGVAQRDRGDVALFLDLKVAHGRTLLLECDAGPLHFLLS